MAESLLLALTKVSCYLAEQGVVKLAEEIKKLRDLPKKVGRIESELRMMNAVVRHVDTDAVDTSDLLKEWIVNVRMLAYRVEDVMDNFSYHALQLEGESFIVRQAKKLSYSKVFDGIASDITQIEEDIQHVSTLRERYLQVDNNQHVQPSAEKLLPQVRFPQFVNDGNLVGIRGYKSRLAEWLGSKEPNSTVITVSGMGGLGKTTLVANVYEQAKSEFHAHAWIAVSKTYSPEALLRTLIRVVGEDKQEQLDIKSIQELRVMLNKKLKDHKTIVVLDDLWDKQVFLDIQDAFNNIEASRVVITTRLGDVASVTNSARRLKLEPLGPKDAFDLFCKRAFANDKDHKCPDDLKDLAKKIVERCHGLPLAIVSIGVLLSSRQQIISIWMQIDNQLRYQLAKNNDVQGIINLSYSDLPAELRNCFLYCSMLPQNALERRSLVLLWVAEGFAVKTDESTAEEVAEGYLMELIHRNMLQLVETDELGRVSTCKMHDIVRDLALSIARKVRFGAANDSGAMSTMDTEVVRRLSTSAQTYFQGKMRLPHLRTLVAHGRTASSSHELWQILHKSKYITVLELQHSEITFVPASIGTLFNLRYLGLRGTRIKLLPDSIEKLSNLQTLDVKSTNIEQLPRGIVKVKKLRHIFADRSDDKVDWYFTSQKGVAAPKMLSNLEELQTLETVTASDDLAQQLEKLKKLGSLWIDNISQNQCKNLFTAVSKLPLLTSLSLAASNNKETLSFQTLVPTSNKLQRLIIKGLWDKGTLNCPIFREHGGNLRCLDISWCQIMEDTLEQLSSYLENLTHLSFTGVNNVQQIVIPAGVFPHLKTLTFKDMPEVMELKIEDGAIPKIEALYLRLMPKLGKIPEGIQSLGFLKKLWMVGLHPEFATRWENHKDWHQEVKNIQELRLI